MPAVIKNVMTFRTNEGYGFSEVHYRQSDSDNPNLNSQLNLLKNVIAVRRAALLGQGDALVGCRVSYKTTNGTVASAPSKPFLIGVEGQVTAAPTLAVVVLFKNANFDKQKNTYLRAFWDSVEHDEAYHPEEGASHDWEGRLNAYLAALKDNKFGWLTRSGTLATKGVVNSYAANTDQTVTFNIAPDPKLDAVVGKNVQMSFSGFGGGKSVLNRAFVVFVESNIKLVTVQKVAIFTPAGKGRYNYRATEFVGYGEVGSVSLGKHNPGRPTGRRPGRARAKALG